MRKTFHPLFFICFAALTLGVCTRANADVVYSDLGPPAAPYFDANGRAVSGSGIGFPGYQEVAIPFTPSGSFNLTQIDVALTFSGVSGVFGTDDATVSLASDSAGAPGSTISSWSLSGLPSSFTGTTLDTIAVSGDSVVAGTQYWLIISPNSTTTDDFWDTNSNPTGVFGNEEINQGSGWVSLAPYDLGAFDVLGTATPEPASAGLVIGGVALIAAGLAKRRRKA